jgi:hypothetical protein
VGQVDGDFEKSSRSRLCLVLEGNLQNGIDGYLEGICFLGYEQHETGGTLFRGNMTIHETWKTYLSITTDGPVA